MDSSQVNRIVWAIVLSAVAILTTLLVLAQQQKEQQAYERCLDRTPVLLHGMCEEGG